MPCSRRGESKRARAAENMMLAAHELGVESCWIGVALGLGEDEEFLKESGVPEGHKLVAPLIFGYPAKRSPKAPARKEDVILKWIDKEMKNVNLFIVLLRG